MSDVLSILLPAVLGTGALGAYLTWRIAKKKAPAEIDSIVVGGAETAVLLLRQALEESEKLRKRDTDRLTDDVEQWRSVVAAQHLRILDLEEKLDSEQPPAT